MEAVKEGAREVLPMATWEMIAQLFRLGTTQAATSFSQEEEGASPTAAVNSDVSIQEDVDVVLDFADGF